MADVKAIIEKLKTQVDANIATDPEKLYYQALTMKEIEQLERRFPMPPGDGTLVLLSPTNVVRGDPRMVHCGYQYSDYYPENIFGSVGKGFWHVQSWPNTTWAGCRFGDDPQNPSIATVYKYSMSGGPHPSESRPSSWRFEVSMDYSNGIAGDWILIDEVLNANPGHGIVVTRDIPTEKLVSAKIARVTVTSVTTNHSSSNATWGNLSIWGVKQ